MDCTITQIVNIKAGMRRINIKAIVLNISYTTSKKDFMKDICELLVADESASCILTVFDTSIMRYINCGDIVLAKGTNAKMFRGLLRVYANAEIYKVGDFCMVFNDKLNISEIEPAEGEVAQQSGAENVLEVKEEESKSTLNDRIFDMLKQNSEKSSGAANSIKSRLGLQRKSLKTPPLYINTRSLSQFNKNKIDSQPEPSYSTFKPPNSFQQVRMQNSPMNLHEMQRKPSVGSISQFNHHLASVSNPPRNMKRLRKSPVKPPPNENIPNKTRIAHQDSSELFRGRDLISYKRENLKNVFYKRNRP